MKDNEAKEFMTLVKDGQLALEQAANYLLSLEPSEENKGLRSKITEIIAITITDVEMPLIAKHPDLNPYK